MLKEAVLLLFAFHQLGDGPSEPNVLSRVAAMHRDIPARYYAPFVDALVATVCGAQGQPPFDPVCADAAQRDAVEEQWRAALEPGIDYMRQRAAVR